MRKLFLLITLLFVFVVCFGQKQQLDTSVIKEWRDLSMPLISPNGKFIVYSIRDDFKDSTFIVVNSGSSNRSNTTRFKGKVSLSMITDAHLLFKDEKDTLWDILLGTSVINKYVGVSQFKLSEDGDILAVLKNEVLVVYGKKGNKTFSNVQEFYFAGNSNNILIKSKEFDKAIFDVIKSVDWRNRTEFLLGKASKISKIVINSSGGKVAFESYDSASNSTEVVIKEVNTSKGISARLNPGKTVRDICGFNFTDELVFIKYSSNDRRELDQNEAEVKIWRYNDDRLPLQNVMSNPKDEQLYSISVKDGTITKLSEQNDQWLYLPSCNRWRDYVLLSQTAGDCYNQEQLWNPACKRNWFKLDLHTGERIRMTRFEGNSVVNKYEYSPDLNYIVYYDESTKSYFSYSVLNDKLVELTQNPEKRIINQHPGIADGYLNFGNRGIAGWSIEAHCVFIYDDYDLWKFDLDGLKMAVPLTNGFGRKNNVILSFLVNADSNISEANECFLVGINTETKDNFFYRTNLLKPEAPKTLGGGKYIFYLPHSAVAGYRGMRPIKAQKSDMYIVRRESCTEFPNYYFTSDFISFKQLSDEKPELRFKWFNTKLYTWKNKDGRNLQGILYLPDDFDSSRKYPVIFSIYQHMSNSLNAYLKPEDITDGCTVNVPLLLSKGYLVFKPDIFYKPDEAGASALSCVASAVEKLSSVAGVDTSRLGIQGCSWGGFETNYIVAHCNYFKAACTASGASDVMGFATIRYDPIYTSFYYGQFRLKSMIWENYLPYVLNSPLFFASAINTPLLIFHTTIDRAVPFNQGVQLFLVLRKLQKKSWLLEYGGSADHGVFDPKQKRDFSIRLYDFFDYYLKSKPIAKWMLPQTSNGG